ncbi:MAG: hypothetical protein PHN39_03640 [Candidatus Pacebacteria bacterium]|nr:hypothetical protein [Candidatus Paceibacterota bacterium]
MPTLGVYFSESKPTGPLFWNGQPLEEPLGTILTIFAGLKDQCIKLVQGIGNISRVILQVKPECECLLVDGIEIVRDNGSIKSLTDEEFASVFPVTPIELTKFLAA